VPDKFYTSNFVNTYKESRRIRFGHSGFLCERAFRPCGLEAAFFPILLAGKAHTHAGDSLEASFGNRFTTFTAAGLAVYPFRAFLKSAGRRLTQSRFALDAFQFRSLIENIHVYIS
jgi:hypothetical protein